MTAPARTLPRPLDLAAVDAVRGRPTGRRRPSGELHAVPHTDRTRTAVCGARVGGTGRPWNGTCAAETCPDCRALLPSG